MSRPFETRRGILRGLAVAIALTTMSTAVSAQATPGYSDPLLRRWVGHHLGRPIFFDFFSDTMLVLNDNHLLDFWFTWDSIVAWGDTSFAVRYGFSYDRLLITTETGTVFTMAPQDTLARPVDAPPGSGKPGLWVAETDSGTIHIQIWRGGTALWRRVPGGSWERGQWSRSARDFRFAWPLPESESPEEPDSTIWTALYDAPRALIFEEMFPGISIAIFRRQHR